MAQGHYVGVRVETVRQLQPQLLDRLPDRTTCRWCQTEVVYDAADYAAAQQKLQRPLDVVCETCVGQKLKKASHVVAGDITQLPQIEAAAKQIRRHIAESN